MVARHSSHLWAALMAVVVLSALPAVASADGSVEIVVKRDPGLSRAERAEVRSDAGVTYAGPLELADAEVVKVDPADVGDALASLRANPDVQYAAVPAEMHAASADPLFGSQWALSNSGQPVQGFIGISGADMRVPSAWQNAPLRGAGVTVGVVDTGVQTSHPDLQGRVAGGRSFVPGVSSYEDDTSPPSARAFAHGTHVSGVIAADADNNIGVAGVAPGASLMELKALDDTGSGSSRAVGDAMAYAGDLGLRIVNASLGVNGLDADNVAFLENVVATHPNTLYVVAAGNDDVDVDDDPEYPCSLPERNIICVGASTSRDERATFSSFGATGVDLFAPGSAIASTWKPSTYSFEDGTSMAAPMVSGIAALVLAQHPTLRAASLRQMILDSVDRPLPLAGLAATSGRANALGAVTLVPADRDGDGLLDALDSCPDQAGVGEDGCAPVVSTAVASAPADQDADGRADTVDACPSTAAATLNGCPLPRLRSLKVKVTPKRCRRGHSCKRSARLTLATDVRTQVALRVERRACSRGRCRWALVASRRTTVAPPAARSLTIRAAHRRSLKSGAYRVRTTLTSGAGTVTAAAKRFSVG